MKERIEAERDLWKTVGTANWVLQEFILRHGQPFISQPLPKRFKLRQIKNCFWNAYKLMRLTPRLRYAEGYVCDSAIPFLIHHAWCVDKENRVIDPTLQDWQTGASRSGDAQYYGIVFDRKFIPRGGGSVLDGFCGYRIENWLKFDPSFAPVLAEAKRYQDRIQQYWKRCALERGVSP